MAYGLERNIALSLSLKHNLNPVLIKRIKEKNWLLLKYIVLYLIINNHFIIKICKLKNNNLNGGIYVIRLSLKSWLQLFSLIIN